jgi:glutamine synthetase
MFNSPDEVTAYIRDNDVKFVDVRFCDLPGVMQHFTIPAETFGPDTFADGLGFDGSSIRGFQAINESDMLLLPDASSAYVDPFRTYKTLNVNFFIHDPITREAYSRDPRNVAKKAEAYLASSGIADTAYFGPEAEFYVFDSVRHDTGINEGYYHIDAVEGSWNSGSRTGENGGPNLGYKTRQKGGYFPVEPIDHQSDLRSAMMVNLANAGLELERGHHEVGTGGQAEINYKFDTLLRSARAPRSCPSRCSVTTARACTATRACGRTASRCSTPRPATRGCPTPPATTSAGCSPTRRRCWPSPTRR